MVRFEICGRVAGTRPLPCIALMEVLGCQFAVYPGWREPKERGQATLPYLELPRCRGSAVGQLRRT